MNLEDFLSRLKKVRKTSPNNWVACCPAHEDKNPSMTIANGNNGGILVHCFALCAIDEITGAVGLTVSDLMPERLEKDHNQGRSRPFPVADVFEAVANETFYVAYMAAALAQCPAGHTLTDTDRALLWQSYERIMEARRIAFGGR